MAKTLIMLESTLEFVRCVGCSSRLELDAFVVGREIREGILKCGTCHAAYPIIEEIPILWNDTSEYFASRRILGGEIYKMIQTRELKQLVKSSLLRAGQTRYEDGKSRTKRGDREDRTALEKRWAAIYQNSRSSKFYLAVRDSIRDIKRKDLVLEYGCSIGVTAAALAKSHGMVFGIDRSFTALQYAKKSHRSNLDYVVSDLLSPVFGNVQFDLVLALNVLDLVEPEELLNRISRQVSNGYVIFADPYDFDRGANSVKRSVDETTLRKSLADLGFEISAKTRHPSFIPWSLRLNPRAILNYKVDLVIGSR